MSKLHAAGLVTALALVAGACTSDENNDQLTDAQGTLIGRAIANQIATVPGTFTSNSLGGTAGGGGIFFSRGEIAAPNLARGPLRSNAACPEVTGDISDTDADGVPADALLTFLTPDCDGITDAGDDYTVEGTMNIQDLATAAVGYTATFSNLVTTVTTATGFIALEFDGSHGVSGTAGGATLQEALTIHLDAQGSGGPISGTVTNDWTISFTAPGNDLAMGSPLPDGTFDVDGSFHYRVEGVNVRFDITTQVPLDFDPSCQEKYPFSAGEFRAHLEGENGNVYAKIEYTGCGDIPDVTFFGRNS